MPHRLGPVALLIVFFPACASKVAADKGAPGSNPEGGASLELGGVDSASPLAVAVSASGATEVCAGQCVELTATATGGRPPYSYAWSGGLPPAASAQVCPATTETVTVVARDASGSSGEVPRPGAQASASVTVTVDSSCSGDGGVPGSPGGDDDAAAANVDAGADGDACSPGITRCSGANVETCLSSGQWGSPWPCATGACSSGSCAGSTTAGASCQPGGNGLTDCGPSGESCCTSLEVAGGTYYRTYTNTGSGPTGEADPATISGFRLDKYLVTVGRFRSFVAAWSGGGYAPPAGSGKHAHLNAGEGLANSEAPGTFETGWLSSDDANLEPTDANLTTSCGGDTGETWTASAGNNESLPITCANWYEAYAFCIWDGGFLPSEAEWEYAAAGGSEQREYPWGSTDPGTSTQYAIYDCNYGPFCANYGIAPVGTASLGAGRWGQLDMAGEVWEWNMDWFVNPYADPCADCAYLGTSGAGRGLRGGGSAMGAWLYAYRQVAPPDEFDTPTTGGDDTGFRCARSP